MDFPAVTVCNLNRVNCHNSFTAMKNLEDLLADSSLTHEERNTTEKYFLTLKTLIGDDVSGCNMRVCDKIKSSTPFIGHFGVRLDNRTISNFFLMLEHCDLYLYEFEMKCQFLLWIQQESVDNHIQHRAASFYKNVSFDCAKNICKINIQLCSPFIKLNCNLHDTCHYCGGSGDEDASGPSGYQWQCQSEKLSNCSVLKQEESQGQGPPGIGKIKKRAPGGEPGDGSRPPGAPGQESYNERLMKHLLSLPENIRRAIGHNLKRSWSIIEEQHRLGFIISCDFQGINCSDERLLYL